MLQVIKVGGAALSDATWLDRFAEAAAVSSTAARVIVHGGGPEITELSTRLGIATEFHQGRRVTSTAGLDVTLMVLNGRINKRIVRALRARGVDAFGLSGEDGATVMGEVVEGGSLGRVGRVAAVRKGVFETLLSAGLVPVLSPVSIGSDFGSLNINADEVAAALAQQMAADELLFLTDVEGVRSASGCLAAISEGEAQQLISSEVATGGMALKLRAGIAALRAGVARVRVGPLEMLWDSTVGTAIHAEEIACR
jgi:acetylglutamate kinase